MKKVLIFIMIVFLFTQVSHAQRWKLKRWEASAGLGTAYISGEIGTLSPVTSSGFASFMGLKPQQIRPSIDLKIRYKLAENQSIKFNFTYGRASGSDANGDNPLRNLSYKSNIIEPTFQYEYYFLKEERRLKSSAIFNKRGMINNFARTSFYGFAGVGAWISISSHEGPAEELVRPGHEFKSFAIGPALPIGLGAKYSLSSNTAFGFELGVRYSVTDFVDGFDSSFGLKQSKDIYSFATVSYIYKIRTDRRGRPILFR